MTLSRRLEKLESTGGDGLVILIVDEFPQDGSEPVIRDAYVSGRHVARDAAEDQDAFLRRVNPRDGYTAMLEADSDNL